ncbi:rhoptry neck protein 6, putative, partial [Hepatocystis sp. ex Piliocolobus tephrosceles]
NNNKTDNKKKKKRYESHMYSADKRLHNKLSKTDILFRNLNDNLNNYKNLKNRELKLKYEAMARIKEYKTYKDLLQKSVEILTLRLMKINEDLKKLKDYSDIALKKYINENGYNLNHFLDLSAYNEKDEEEIINRRITDKKKDKLYCPMDCDRNSCHNNPPTSTQCYGFNHCAMALPERNKKYSIFASDEKEGVPQFIKIKGYNLHECLQLIVLNKGSSCLPTDFQNNLAEFSEILPEPALIKVLHDEILFENIKISKPGEYNLCLAQFYEQPYNTEEKSLPNKFIRDKKKEGKNIKILGIDSIGTLYVLPLPSKKKIE